MGDFGDIYWIPANKHSKLATHWVVLLYANKANNEVYLQSLSSRIYKVFPNFGSFTNTHCLHCSNISTSKDLNSFKNYLTRGVSYLSVDNVVFLDFNKYSFLRKETYISFLTVEKDNYFDFAYKTSNNIYKYQGNLFKNHCQLSLVALRNSGRMPMSDVNNILNFYKLTII